jgi:hypothetical protein
MASDAQTAKTLRDKLAAARKKLLAMNRTARRAATAAPARSPVRPAGDDDHDGDPDHG